MGKGRVFWSYAALWAPGLAVAAGAAVATAHGLFEVAAGAGVPTVIAWLYPLITDGLALVAYASTARLHDRGRHYAWSVVVLAAGLSGLAQASKAAGLSAASAGLRFGVGAWPAIAAAIVAHLLFMLRAESRPRPDVSGSSASAVGTGAPATVESTVQPSVQSGVQSDVHGGASPRSTCPVVQPATPVQPVVQPSVQSGVQSAVRPPAGARSTPAPVVRPERVPGERRTAGGGESGASERARGAARRHAARHGVLPTATELVEAAGVSRGTAGAVLKELREARQPLRIVSDSEEASSTS